LSWEEVKFYAGMLDFKTVPELATVKPTDQKSYETQFLNIVNNHSSFGSLDNGSKQPCKMEGIVSRNMNEYKVSEFKMNVFKYVRKNHVQTDEHWSKKPRRATLVHERPVGQDPMSDNDKIIK